MLSISKVTMGTGIVSTILITIPWKAQWLYWLSIVFFALNVCLFAAALTTSILRYTLYPEIWTVMIQDSTNSLFLGTIPMGFATIVEMWIFICVPAWGPWAASFAWALWMVDSLVAVAVTLSLGILLYVMVLAHPRTRPQRADHRAACPPSTNENFTASPPHSFCQSPQQS